MTQTQYVSQKRLKQLIRISIILVIIAAVIFTIYGVVQDRKTLTVGEHAPDFTLKTIDGQKISLSDFRGKGVLVNFWASWCKPCKAEMPYINQAYHELPPGVAILAINIRENPQAAQAFLSERHIDFPVILDRLGKVTESYNVVKIPTSYLIDKNGVVVKKIVDPMTSTIAVLKQLKQVEP